ncbi:MAG: cysteine desulfurase NifS [Clostridia bacterium]|nr:cysteine desulfurase NifS [Clostridia bacterium]
MTGQKFIYVDNAATTKTLDIVASSMLEIMTHNFGNPSSIYKLGANAKQIIDNARTDIASLFSAKPNEIYFTSGGSESDNWAIKGAAKAMALKGKKHIITSKIEHHAVLHTLDSLKKDGFDVTYLDVYEDGIIKIEDLKNAIRPDTALVSIMYANNEIGTIQPVKEIGAVCKEHNILFHTDAVQAVGHIKINVDDDNIDLMSASAHKLHGPKGVGLLYMRNSAKIKNLIDGGAQERGKRAGTENVAGIAGFSIALKIAYDEIEQKNKKVRSMRDRLINSILKIDRSILNGHPTQRLPGNINVCFKGIEGESLLLNLDLIGVSASSGSACTSGSLDPSHVLLALGLKHEVAHGSLRISLDEYNTDEEIDYIINNLPGIVAKLRAMSPLWEKIIKEDEI